MLAADPPVHNVCCLTSATHLSEALGNMFGSSPLTMTAFIAEHDFLPPMMFPAFFRHATMMGLTLCTTYNATVDALHSVFITVPTFQDKKIG